MDDSLPRTIIYPKKFLKSKPAGWDGAFDWSWTEGCFGDTNITPMDLDGVVERNGQKLVFETKDPGKEVPDGQLRTLKSMYADGKYTIMIVWGKTVPEEFEVWYPHPYRRKRRYSGVEMAREVVTWWFQFADSRRP